MFGVVIFTALLHGCIGDPRTPRIYNVLISSKKNLAPSQALPVYQPVLRSTSVGLAFPPIYYTSLNPGPGGYIEGYELGPTLDKNDIRGKNTNVGIPNPLDNTRTSDNDNRYQNRPSNTVGLPNNVIPLQQYLPYFTTNINYQPFFPEDENPKAASVNTAGESSPKTFESVNDNNPKQIVANFKKNPEIPDVPPPPLPVRTNLNS